MYGITKDPKQTKTKQNKTKQKNPKHKKPTEKGEQDQRYHVL